MKQIIKWQLKRNNTQMSIQKKKKGNERKIAEWSKEKEK